MPQARPVAFLAKPAAAHPCGQHPCVIGTDIVHGAESKKATKTLCGRGIAAPGSLSGAASKAVDTGNNCKTCVKKASKTLAAAISG